MAKHMMMALAVLVVSILASCGETTVSYRINFESNGGSEVSSVTTEGNETIDMPEDPVRDGHVFAGWFFDDNTFEQPFTSSSLMGITLTQSITVYAKWDIDPEATFWTVTFETDGGSVIPSQEVLDNTLPTLPEDPDKEGFTFAGWFTDAPGTSPFDPGQVISQDMTLFAGWDVVIVTHTVTFETYGGTSVTDIDVVDGEAAGPVTDPSKEGHTFAGWYTDGTLSTPFDVTIDPVTEDMTLHAGWTVDSYTVTYVVTEIAFDPETVAFGDPVPLPTLPEESGYDDFDLVFYSDPAHTERYVPGTMPASDLTLYGLLQAKPGTLSYDFLYVVPSSTVTSREALSLYLDYMFFNRIPTADLLLDYTFESVPEEVSEAFSNRLLQVNVAIDYSWFDGGNETTVTATYQDEAVLPASTEPLYQQKAAILSPMTSNRLPSYDDFAVNAIERTYPVVTSDQLYYVLEQGYRPVFETPDTPAQVMYEAAKSVLRSIIDDDMTTIQKLEAIYRYLVFDVTYDKALLDKMMAGEDDINRYNGFYLEGVFTDGRAVCDGISKAFTVLARIEGIEVIRVIGKPADPTNTILHAWNKVNINGAWHVIDATSANLIINGTYEFFNYKFFMVTDAVMETSYIQTSHSDILAVTPYNHYETVTFTIDDQTHDRVITSQEELDILFDYIYETGLLTHTIDVMIGFDVGESIIDEIQTSLNRSGLSTILPVVSGNILILIGTLD
jgi:uncharacterized repeat protein (TIGR02543 family)